MHGKTLPHKVYVVDNVRIGVFGLGIELENLVNKTAYKETIYLDPLEIAHDMERKLKYEENCDIIICLSHLGYDYERNKQRPSDINIASQTSYIDLIIGGHTHTFLPEPTQIINKAGKVTLVNQVGCFGINLGRIDFYIEEKKVIDNQSLSIVV